MRQIVIGSVLFTALAAAPVVGQDADATRAEVVAPSIEQTRDQFLEYHPAADGERIREVVQRFSMDPHFFTQESGKQLYEATCQGCHMADAKGAAGAGHYPPLAGNPKLISKFYIISVVLNGYHGMPHFRQQMSDKQISALVNYVRSNFGNQFPDEATPEDVGMLRGH